MQVKQLIGVMDAVDAPRHGSRSRNAGFSRSALAGAGGGKEFRRGSWLKTSSLSTTTATSTYQHNG
jgi:hypothetical protein